jgi:hypothetical protein
LYLGYSGREIRGKKYMSNPKSDRIFKQIFLHHPDSLMHLLNSFLPLEAPIEALEYMPMELLSEYGSLQMTIVDVRCRDRQGRHFIVEMQLQKMPMFFRRVLTNACRIYSRQFRNGGSSSRSVRYTRSASWTMRCSRTRKNGSII